MIIKVAHTSSSKGFFFSFFFSNHSKLGAILRECLGSLTCRAVVMIHISNSHSRYAETLAALQLGSRVHRLRRSRRLKVCMSEWAFFYSFLRFQYIYFDKKRRMSNPSSLFNFLWQCTSTWIEKSWTELSLASRVNSLPIWRESLFFSWSGLNGWSVCL